VKPILPSALIVSALSAWWAYMPQDGLVDAVAGSRTAAPNDSPRVASHQIALAKTASSQPSPDFSINRSLSETAHQDLFSAKQWKQDGPTSTPNPSPILVPEPTPPPPPQAPALPFRYVGRLQHGGEPEIVFLQLGERAIETREGATLERHYVLEKIEARVLRFRYLPLNQVQSLTIEQK
jgi:hypothetical protein